MPVKSGRVAAAARPAAERVAQKRRTRKAIVDAAIALLARGRTPTVTDVAAAADVSRRTVFLHFPAFDQLLLDATVGMLSEAPIQHALERASPDDDPAVQVGRLVRAVHRVTPEVERLGRSLVRLTLGADAATPARGTPRRGYRRIEWIESSLAPWRSRLDPLHWRRLVCGLAMVIGWEALIAQRDVCGLTPAEGEELSVWAAQALVRATLDETAGATRVRTRSMATSRRASHRRGGRRERSS